VDQLAKIATNRAVVKLMSLFDLSIVSSAIENSAPLCGGIKIVTIDGPAGSGKTTLANEIAIEFAKSKVEVSVVHLDELYEGWDNALDSVLFERIEAWVLAPLRNGLGPKHLKYDWHLDKYTTWSELPASPIVIIEGVGSGHSSLREQVSQAIWVEADENLLLDRVVQRDGEGVRDEMLIWKAREQAYFELHEVKQSAQIHLRGQ
jgi:uridine kinase